MSLNNTSEKQERKGNPDWVKGKSANPAGRPKGSRNKLSEEFIKALVKDFEQFGEEAICMVREEKTDAYLKVIASLVPKEMHLKVDPLEEFTIEQLISRARELANIISLTGIQPSLEGDKGKAGQEPARELPPLH